MVPATLLIVEDDNAIAETLSDFMSMFGYVCLRAGDGLEALAMVDQHRPDLIVMDLMLPRLTGGEAAQTLRCNPLTARIPIVAISAVTDVRAIADMLPIDAVLPKPFNLDELLTTIEQLLARRRTPLAAVAT